MIVISMKDCASIRIEIARKGNSLREFSKKIGISHPYLSQILNGKRNPSATVAYKVANGLSLKVDDIFLIENVAKDNPLHLATHEIEVKS